MAVRPRLAATHRSCTEKGFGAAEPARATDAQSATGWYWLARTVTLRDRTGHSTIMRSRSPLSAPHPKDHGATPRRLGVAVVIGVVIASICRAADNPAPSQPTGTATVASHPAPPPYAYTLPAEDRDLIALDDEMRRYFAARIDGEGTQERRLNEVVAAVLGEQGLHLKYVEDANLSARETFRQRKANCLAFALLTVALCRTYGVPAQFCEVNTYPRWDRYGNLVTEVRHLNVQVSAGGARYELDLLPIAERQSPVASAKLITDARAFAHFYNNLGVFRLADGARAEALALFDRALAADPTAAFVWANKGSALRLTGDLAAAQVCLERAVHEDSSDLSALSSLANHYAQTGQRDRAAKLEKKVERYQRRNPYYLHLRARSAYDHGQYREADKLLRKAIAIKDDEPEFYELRIQVARSLGQPADVQRWTNKLNKLREPHAPAMVGN